MNNRIKKIGMDNDNSYSDRPSMSQNVLAKNATLSNAGLRSAVKAVSQHCIKFVLTSAAVVIPCFWHRHIEAGDLGSHVYNAWLIQLIHQGKAPGLWIARQWNNILFDLLLSGLGGIFGLHMGEKIAVAVAVLILFWGTFAFVCAASRRARWQIIPVVAIFTYGWTFHAGFFNYYLSIGLAFFGIALFWRGSRWERVLAVASACVIYLAHPLGVIWLLGACAYIGLAQNLNFRYHPILLGVPAVMLLGLHYYLWHRYKVSGALWPVYLINGVDQVVLFGHRYMFLYFGALVFIVICIAADVRRRAPGEIWANYGIALQLYILLELGVFLLPNTIEFSTSGGPLGYLVERLSTVSAALVCCLLGAMLPKRWHVAGFAALAAVFFTFVYQDTARLNRMEQRVEALIDTIPRGQRVMETVLAPAEWKLKFINHMVDRACIDRCFAYGNYEPSSEQFRVRAAPGNSIVMNWPEDMGSMEAGDYEVQEADLPAYQIYQCSERVTDLCIRRLEAGEDNDRLGIHPNRSP